MTVYYLINSVVLARDGGMRTLLPGTPIDTSVTDILDDVRKAGGDLRDASDARVVAAADRARDARMRGADSATLASIMSLSLASSAEDGPIQPDWYVDPVAGNDSADGMEGAPLRTSAALVQRFGRYSRLASPVTVHFTSAPDDPLNLLQTLSNTAVLILQGAPAEPLADGTLDAVGWDPDTNAGLTLTCAAVDWTGSEGKRVRIAGGDGDGAVAFVLEVVSTHVVQTTPFASPDLSDPGALAVVQYLPEAGDDFVVESVMKLPVDDFNVVGGAVVFQDVDLSDNAVLNLSGNCVVALSRSIVGAQAKCVLATGVTAWLASFGVAGSADIEESGQCTHLAGGTHSYIFTDLAGGVLRFDADFTFHGCHFELYSGVTGFFSQVAVFRSPEAHGIHIHPQASFSLDDGAYGDARMWGKDNAVCGVSLAAGARLLHQDNRFPTITGGAANSVAFLMNGAATARAWDEAGGVYTAARACTWANLAAAVGAGGFGGGAHAVQSDAHILSRPAE